MKTDKITYSLQSVRIFAALIIMFVHVQSILSSKYGEENYTYFAPLHFGISGVHLFFVLSGFVMYMVHDKDIGKGLKPAGIFAWKRFLRIYPTYWIITTLVVISMFLVPGEVKEHKYNPYYIIESYSLFKMGLMNGNPIVPAAWTLFHEIKFYFLFLLLIAIPNKKMRIAMIGVTAALTASSLIFDYANWPLLRFYFTSFNWVFGLGILAGWLTKKYYMYLKSKAFLLISVLAYILVSIICDIYLWETTHVSILSFGLVSFMVITSFASYETYVKSQSLNNPFKIGNSGLLLADTTYCLYLLHYPIYTIVFMLNARFLHLPDIPLGALMILTAIAVSLLFYKLIEFPVLSTLRGITTNKKRVTMPKSPEIAA